MSNFVKTSSELTGTVVSVTFGNHGDVSYTPSHPATVMASYTGPLGPVYVCHANRPARGEGYYLVYEGEVSEDNPCEFQTTNGRLIGEGFGRVTDLAHAIKAFGLEE